MTRKIPSHEQDAAGTSAEGSAQRGQSRRRSVVDRRLGIDRRNLPDFATESEGDLGAASGRSGGSGGFETNLERRRGPGRRRTDFIKAADEGEMTQEQFMFLMAIDAFKRVNGKTFPSWTDVLEIIRKLGYRKTMPSTLNLGGRAEDWLERPDAPSGVTKITEPDAEAA